MTVHQAFRKALTKAVKLCKARKGAELRKLVILEWGSDGYALFGMEYEIDGEYKYIEFQND